MRIHNEQNSGSKTDAIHSPSVKDKVTCIIVLSVSFLILNIFLIGAWFNFPTTVYADSDDQKVYDFYGLFTEEEVSDLEALSKKYGEEGKVDIVIITEGALDGITGLTYLEDFYDEYGFGYNQEFGDAVLLLINMDPDPDRREVIIQGYGDAEYYVNNDRIEHILDEVAPRLTNGDYFKAMQEYVKQSAYYMNQEKGTNTTPATGEKGSGNYYGESTSSQPTTYYGEGENIFFNSFFQLAIALVIGGVAVGIMAFHSSGRVTVNNRTYLDPQHSGVVARKDDYIRTTTTKVRKPTNNNNGGGGGRSSGGGGVSSGGHSHSGGSRGF